MSAYSEGYAAIPRALLWNKEIPWQAKIVWLGLSAHVGPRGCFPKIETLADELGMAQSTVKTHIRKLCDLGYLTARRTDGSNNYVLHDVALPPDERRPITIGAKSRNPAVAPRVVSEPSQEPENGPAESRNPAAIEHKRTNITERQNEKTFVARKRASVETTANSSPPDKPPRATRLPADWVPSADLVTWGRRDRLPDDFMRRETENFRDFWTAHAGPTARKLSWDAAWRTWMRKAADHARLAHPVISRAQRETDDLFAGAAARMVPQPPTLGEFNDARRNLGTDPFSESGLPSAETGSVHTGRVASADGGPALW